MMVTQKSHGKNIKICTSTILNEFSKLKVSLSMHAERARGGQLKLANHTSKVGVA